MFNFSHQFRQNGVWKKIWERNWTWGHNCNTKCFDHTFFTNCKGKWFFNIKKCTIFHKHFLLHIILFLRDFWNKTSKYGKMEIFTFFFASCLSTFSLLWLSISSQNFFKIIGWFTSRCFYKHELCHLFCNMVDPSLIIFLHSKKRHVENDRTNNASFEEHQDLFFSCS